MLEKNTVQYVREKYSTLCIEFSVSIKKTVESIRVSVQHTETILLDDSVT